MSFDTLRFGPDIRPEDLWAERGNDDLILYVNDDDAVRIALFFNVDDGESRIERIEFADGTACDDRYLTLSRGWLDIHKPPSPVLSRLGDGDVTVEARDILRFGAGIDPGDLYGERDGDDLNLRLLSSGDERIRLDVYFEYGYLW